MAYQVNFKKWEKEFPEAYFQVNTVIWKVIDDELHIDENGHTVIKWLKKEICEALIGIYQNEQSRLSRVAALDIIKVPFVYEKDSTKNLIQQAYDKLKTLEPFIGGIDV